jgi:type I thyroxine 5'-deiodinase
LFLRYRDRIAFYVVYINEAHPSDIWQIQSNIRDHVVFRDPTTSGQREEIANSCVRKLHLAIPALINSMDNCVEQNYTAWPDRLYLVGIDGRIRFKSDPGPFGFSAKELENAVLQYTKIGSAPQ